jgi:O-methyltransferase
MPISNNNYRQLFMPYTNVKKELDFLVRYKTYVEDPRNYSMGHAHEWSQMEKLIRNVHNDHIIGDIVETGIWRGGMGMWIKAVLNHLHSKRNVWLFDAFGPFPPAQHPLDQKIDPIVRILFERPPTIEEVENNFVRLGLMDDSVFLIKGDFKDTIPLTKIDHIAILRLDGDYYESTKIVLDNYYHLISKGGYVVIDDYNNNRLACKQAVDEFRKQHGIVQPLLPKNERHSSIYWQV